jgi:hypothetical protein
LSSAILRGKNFREIISQSLTQGFVFPVKINVR